MTSTDGTELEAWTNDADGPTVLLCNGLGTNPYTWPAFLDPDCGVRVISWNHRGVCGSARPVDPDRVGVEVDVEDALALLDHAGIDACPVIGWSIGVNSMFELAATHPERVTGLFAVAGVPGDTFASMLAPLHLPRFVRKPFTVGVARVLQLTGRPLTAVASRLPIGPVSGLVVTHSGFMLPVPDVPLARQAIREFLTTPIEWYMQLALASSLHLRVSLRDIEVPTTFVAAKYDVLASSYDIATAAERIPGAEYVELRGSHFVQMEKPSAVHALLLELLARVAAEADLP
ncbi:MAG: alpha/beta hydrolase [Marmoricola sp.]